MREERMEWKMRKGREKRGRGRCAPTSTARSASGNHGPISHRFWEENVNFSQKSQNFHIPVRRSARRREALRRPQREGRSGHIAATARLQHLAHGQHAARNGRLLCQN